MQRLHAAVEHLREASEVGDVFYRDAGIAQQLGGTAGGDQLHAVGCELLGEIGEAGFVGNRENCALNLGHESSGRKIVEIGEPFILNQPRSWLF